MGRTKSKLSRKTPAAKASSRRRDNETEEQRQNRISKLLAAKLIRLSNETPEQRAKRLAENRERGRAWRQRILRMRKLISQIHLRGQREILKREAKSKTQRKMLKDAAKNDDEHASCSFGFNPDNYYSDKKDFHIEIKVEESKTEPHGVCFGVGKDQLLEEAGTSDKILVFCPVCNTQVEHTAKGIQQDQTNALIANVYHYFEQEYKELKKMYPKLDLSPLSRFQHRTALATGVSETKVVEILREEQRRDAGKQEPPLKRQRLNPADSSHDEDSSDGMDGADCADEHPGSVHDSQYNSENETLELKIEPPEEDCNVVFADPLAVKEEPCDDEENTCDYIPTASSLSGTSTSRVTKGKNKLKQKHNTLTQEQIESQIVVKAEPCVDEDNSNKTVKGKSKSKTQQYRRDESFAPEFPNTIQSDEEIYDSCPNEEIKLKIEIDEEGFS